MGAAGACEGLGPVGQGDVVVVESCCLGTHAARAEIVDEAGPPVRSGFVFPDVIRHRCGSDFAVLLALVRVRDECLCRFFTCVRACDLSRLHKQVASPRSRSRMGLYYSTSEVLCWRHRNLCRKSTPELVPNMVSSVFK